MTTQSDKPPITFALFAYNQEHFVREAIESAFAQTYEPLEIILSDDCSSDRTYAVMEEMANAYVGPHKITLNRNEKNLGIGGHVNKMMELMSTDLIVVAAGDDVSLPHRTEVLAEAFEKADGKAISIYSAVMTIDSQGKELGVARSPAPKENAELKFRIMRNTPGVHGASHAWHRRVFDVFGPLGDSVIAEDRAIAFRAYELGEVVYLDTPLVNYRTHEANVCHTALKPQTIEEHRRSCQKLARLSISIYRQYLIDLNHQLFFNNHGIHAVEIAIKTARRKLVADEKYCEFMTASRLGQLKVIISSMLLGVSHRKTTTWFARWCFPWLYEYRVRSRIKDHSAIIIGIASSRDRIDNP